MLLTNPIFMMFVIMAGLILYSAWTDNTTMKLLNASNICIALTALASIVVFPERPSLTGIGIGLSAGAGAVIAGWVLSKPLKTDDSLIGFLAMIAICFAVFLGGSRAASAYFPVTQGDIDAWKDLAAAAIVSYGALAILHGLMKMGAGDIKFLAALSIWFGWEYGGDFVVLSAILGGVLAVITKIALKVQKYDCWGIIHRAMPFLVIGKGKTIPYGVSISFAALYIMFWEQARDLGVI